MRYIVIILILLLSILIVNVNSFNSKFLINNNELRSSSLYSYNNNYNNNNNKNNISIKSNFLIVPLIISSILTPNIAYAKDPLPSLEKCFNAVRKEIDPKQGESIKRIKEDINKGDWEDLKLFTREYDAGFRGGVLKSAWKQLEGENKKKGVDLSNSFTFDLIAINKAGREENKEKALIALDSVIQDLTEFTKLEPK